MAGAHHSANATVAAKSAVAITPTDGVAIPATRSLFVGGFGDVTVVMAENGATITFSNVTAGSILPVQAIAVNATGTSATNIVALY